MLSHTSQSLSSASPIELSGVPNLKKRQELPAMLSVSSLGESKKEGEELSQPLTDESQASTAFSALLLKEVKNQTTEAGTFDGEVQSNEAKLASAMHAVFEIDGDNENLSIVGQDVNLGRLLDSQMVGESKVNVSKQESETTQSLEVAFDGSKLEGFEQISQTALSSDLPFTSQIKSIDSTELNTADVENSTSKEDQNASDLANNGGGFVEDGQEIIQPLVADASLAGQEKNTLETNFNEGNYDDKTAEVKLDESSRIELESSQEASLAGETTSSLYAKLNIDDHDDKTAEIKLDEPSRIELESAQETLAQLSYAMSQPESGDVKAAAALKGQIQGAQLNQPAAKQKAENVVNASKQSSEVNPFAEDVEVEDDPILKGGVAANLASTKMPATGHTPAFYGASATQGAVGNQTAHFVEQLQKQQNLLKHQAAVKESDLTVTAPLDGAVLKSVDGGSVVATDKAASAPMQFASITHSISSQKWGEALGKHLIVAANKSMQKMQIMLNPEKLGPIQVQLHLNKDKQLHVALSANHVLTREAMMEAMPRLREMLESNGVQLGSMDVSDKGFNEEQQSEHSLKEAGSRVLDQSAEETLNAEDNLLQTQVSLGRNVGMINYYA